ncbi:hypothetical protein RI129_005080 [Pyrocoelia pectoralis]|uniref:Uncharacterized protein n=1 Tax=Pyrocoelia pectoralis TaxID=417401 RepID=A0AAN7VJF3_9COLE
MSSNYLKLLILLLVNSILVSSDEPYEHIIEQVISKCATNSYQYSCLADHAAVIVEDYVYKDIPIFNGLVLTKTKKPIEAITKRSFTDGFSRLKSALKNFVGTHTLTLDLTPRSNEEGRQFGKKKGGKKGGGGMELLMLPLFGIYGFIVPLVMKGLALIAGKALIAAKLALLIAGSVGIKKLFEKDHSHASIKVLSHHDVDDRNIEAGAYQFLRSL